MKSLSFYGKKLTASNLKWIAIIAMLIDHVAFVYYGEIGLRWYTFMDLIGKITGPVMFYFLVEGFHHTRNVKRYLSRLAIFAVISYLPFIYCFTGGLPNQYTWNRFNIIYTLFFCLLILCIKHSTLNFPIKLILIILCYIVCLTSDWYYLAPTIVLLFDAFYGDFKKQRKAYCIFVVVFLALTGLALLVPDPVTGVVPISTLNGFSELVRMAGLFLPIWLLSYYNGERGNTSRWSKWFFYVFYPAHLLILGLLAYGFLFNSIFYLDVYFFV